MKKRICLLGIAIVCIIIAVFVCFKVNNANIITMEEERFLFDGVAPGSTEEDFLKLHKDAVLSETVQGIWGEERIYTRELWWKVTGQNMTAYYDFDEQGFQRGVYEIIFPLEETEEVFSKVCQGLIEILEPENESHRWKPDLHLFASWFERRMDEMRKSGGKTGTYSEGTQFDSELRLPDQKGGNMRIKHYKLAQEAEGVILLEVYRDSGWVYDLGYRWPDDSTIVWDVDTDGNDSDKAGLTYEEVGVLYIRADAIWATNEEGECVEYNLSPDCSIWGLQGSAQWVAISLEQMAEVEMSSECYSIRWIFGVNAAGQVEHIKEGYVP